jgi:hypothetical protein
MRTRRYHAPLEPDLCTDVDLAAVTHEVGTSTMVRPGADAALIRVDGTGSALALATDCNARHVFLDPRLGACGQVAEAARNLACLGAEAIGLTDCLNFGSPERPDVMWQFSEAVDGISEACRALGIPVVSWNVSFYNESDVEGAKSAIHPTPPVAVVGLVPDASFYRRARASIPPIWRSRCGTAEHSAEVSVRGPRHRAQSSACRRSRGRAALHVVSGRSCVRESSRRATI